MAKTAEQMMEIMVEPLREHCPEPLHTAMVCSHAGSMTAVILSSVLRGTFSGTSRTSALPNPVLIGVGDEGVYAFAFKPRGFKMKVKKEVARWPRADVSVVRGDGKRINAFTLITPDGFYEFEVTTMGRDESVVAFDRFLDSIGLAPNA